MPSVFIAIPSYDAKIYTDTMLCLLNNLRTLDKNGISYILQIIANESLITRARNRLMSQFLSTECSHMLFIDADLTFPDNAIQYLLNQNKDVIGGAYPKKKFEWELIENEVKNGTPIQKAIEKTGGYIMNVTKTQVRCEGSNIEVDEVGTGFLMLSRDAVEKLKSVSKEYHAYPNEKFDYTLYEFFKTCINEETGYYLSEDYYLCTVLKKLGYTIWLSTNIPFGHYGTSCWRGLFSRKIRD